MFDAVSVMFAGGHTHEEDRGHAVSSGSRSEACGRPVCGGGQRPGGARAVREELQTETHQAGLHSGEPRDPRSCAVSRAA